MYACSLRTLQFFHKTYLKLILLCFKRFSWQTTIISLLGSPSFSLNPMTGYLLSTDMSVTIWYSTLCNTSEDVKLHKRWCHKDGFLPVSSTVLNTLWINLSRSSKVVYAVLTHRRIIQNTSFGYMFRFYKTIFRPIFAIWGYILCVRTLWDRVVFT